MWRLAAMVVLALPLAVQAQAADMFSCVEPGRLTARTLEYRSGDYRDYWTVAPVAVGDRRLVRVTKRRTREAVTTAEHTIDLEAESLAPTAFRIMSAARGLTSDLVLQGDQLTGRLVRTEVSVSTGGGPVLFGASVEDVLVAAVDWDRCAAVSVKSFGLNGTRRDQSFTRVAERVVTISGRELPVYEVLRESGEFRSRLFVTKSAPFLLARIEDLDPAYPPTELVALPR